MNYKEVFELAKSKGYKLYLPDIFSNQYSAGTKAEGYSDLAIEAEVKNTELFLELTLIQKWLREKHLIHAWIGTDFYKPDKPVFFARVESLSSRSMGDKLVYGFTGDPVYENALLKAIYESLKLIDKF